MRRTMFGCRNSLRQRINDKVPTRKECRKGAAPGDFNFVREIGEHFGVAAKLKIEWFFYGNRAAAVSAFVPVEQRVVKWRH